MKTSFLILLSAILGAGVAIVAVAWDVGAGTNTAARLGLVAPHDTGPHAKVGIESVLFDARQIDLHSQQRHAFVFRNDGSVPLKLNLGETSCQCTSSILEKEVVPPGESTDVTVEWKTEQMGEFRHTATVLTNDPTRPRVALSVVGIVMPIITIEPPEVILGNFPSSNVKTAEVRVFSFRDETLEFTGHDLANPKLADYFDVTIAPAPASELRGADAKSGNLVTITIKPGLPGGPIQQTIRLTKPDGGRLEIPVRGNAVQ